MKRCFILLILSIIIVSCDSSVVSTESQEFTNTRWALDDDQSFLIKSPDTIKKYDLFLHLRNTHEYNFNNLWLISKIKFPMGKVITDTLEYQMAYPNGEFIGTHRANGIVENKLWLKKGIRFTENGEYLIELKHAMRKNGNPFGVNELEGVMSIGYTLEHPITDNTALTEDSDL